jgi:hypothetical protein
VAGRGGGLKIGRRLAGDPSPGWVTEHVKADVTPGVEGRTATPPCRRELHLGQSMNPGPRAPEAWPTGSYTANDSLAWLAELDTGSRGAFLRPALADVELVINQPRTANPMNSNGTGRLYDLHRRRRQARGGLADWNRNGCRR